MARSNSAVPADGDPHHHIGDLTVQARGSPPLNRGTLGSLDLRNAEDKNT